MIRRQPLYALAAIAGVTLALAGVGISRALANFGMSPGQAFGVFRELRANAIAIRNAEGPIDTPNGIAESGFVKIGGIDQWITIRGEDRRNPAILIVHGGLGDAQSQLAYLYRHWQRDFTVVQWDQRGAGHTYGRYGTATPDMTLERMIQDGAEVANYARNRLGQKKLILLGHSCGSALGIDIVKRYPIDLNSLGVEMPIPFFIIDGLEDHLAPPDLARQYFQTIRAPQKAMFLINNAGHFAAMSNSDEFLKILVNRVRPVALSERTSAPAPKASTP